MANEVAKVEEKAVAEYGAGVNLGDFFADELDGLTPSFERIKIPAGGGLAFEVEYTGGNNPPDCGSMDGHVGIEAETGEVKNCAECEFSKFGTGKNGAKACKQKRRIYLLREGEALPIILSLPTGSLGELSKYIVRVRAKYAGTYCVVTKFTLKKAQNSGGINYSQAVFAIDRALTEDELKNIVPMCEQVKALSKKVTQLDEE